MKSGYGSPQHPHMTAALHSVFELSAPVKVRLQDKPGVAQITTHVFTGTRASLCALKVKVVSYACHSLLCSHRGSEDILYYFSS